MRMKLRSIRAAISGSAPTALALAALALTGCSETLTGHSARVAEIAPDTTGATTGNIAAGLGLHAGWVWVMLVAHELTKPVDASPLRFLLSRFDGFVGWLVLAWTIPMGVGLWWFYRARQGRAAAPVPS